MKRLFAFFALFGSVSAISQGIPPQCNVVIGGNPVNYGCETYGLRCTGGTCAISRLNCTEPTPGIMPWALRPKFTGTLDGRTSNGASPAPYTLRSGDGAVGSDVTSYKPGELMVLYLRVLDYNFKFRGLLGYARPASDNTRRVGDWEQPDPELYASPWVPGNDCQGGLTHSSARIKPFLSKLYWRAPAAGTGSVAFEFLIKQGDANTGAFFYPATQLVLTEGVSTAPPGIVLAMPAQSCTDACVSDGATCDPARQTALTAGGLTDFQTNIAPWYSCDHMFAACDNSDPSRVAITNDCTYVDPTCATAPTTSCSIVSTTDSRFCACTPDPCNPNPCNPTGGTCSARAVTPLTEDDWICTCNTGFAGVRCDTLQPTCGATVAGTYQANYPCLNGGTCITPPVGSASVTCDCTSSFGGAYSGSTCEVPPPCLADPCTSVDSAATCNNVAQANGSFVAQCHCSTGYSGPTCTVIDGCAIRNLQPSQHCVSPGYCVDNPLDTATPLSSCNCPLGYVGGADSLCYDLDECAFGSNPCVHGMCQNLPGTYQCVCDAGWAGPACDQDASSPGVVWCTPINQCINGGTCYECSAASLQAPCVAADIPTGYATSFHCDCPYGFTGNKCQTAVNHCATNPCLNGGVCSNNPLATADPGYTCTCQSGYTGANCQTDIDDCAAVAGTACANGGTCRDGVNTFTCECQTGYTGADCRTVVLGPSTIPCGTADCPPGSQCNGVGQNAVCDVIGCLIDSDCPSGYTCTGNDVPAPNQDKLYCVETVAPNTDASDSSATLALF